MGCSLWGPKELGTTERLTLTYLNFFIRKCSITHKSREYSIMLLLLLLLLLLRRFSRV